jgi:murein L,D-transpeptidase YafK
MRLFFWLATFLFATVFLYSAQKPSTTKPFPKIDLILVEKSARVMSVFHEKTKLKTYKIALGFSPIGHREQEGNGKTPEGIYYINDKNPNSGWHKNLGISLMK